MLIALLFYIICMMTCCIFPKLIFHWENQDKYVFKISAFFACKHIIQSIHSILQNHCCELYIWTIRFSDELYKNTKLDIDFYSICVFSEKQICVKTRNYDKKQLAQKQQIQVAPSKQTLYAHANAC